MFNWEGVSEFMAVAETSSFTSAAKLLGISTAQVSRQISELEDRLAVKLFYRTTRKVTITEAGQVYYHHCKPLIEGLEEAERAITQHQTVPKGKLRMTAPTTFGESKIAPLVSEFIAKYPALEVEIHFTNQKVDLVKEGYDLAIRLGKLEDSSMMAKRLASRKLQVCGSPDYLAKHGTPHLIQELDKHNCLLGTLEFWRFQESGQERNIRVKGNIRFNSGLALTDAALKGLGLVQLPDYYIQQHFKTGCLIPVLNTFQPEDEGIWALYPNNRFLSPKVRMLIEYLAENVLELLNS
ncbi:LysR substrate-binding domain-containing protein [Neptuniibacter caesariensis]|nr:LysR substrate-binding domain-containing protein [Neptuniibacter caesariensis]